MGQGDIDVHAIAGKFCLSRASSRLDMYIVCPTHWLGRALERLCHCRDVDKVSAARVENFQGPPSTGLDGLLYSTMSLEWPKLAERFDRSVKPLEEMAMLYPFQKL